MYKIKSFRVSFISGHFCSQYQKGNIFWCSSYQSFFHMERHRFMKGKMKLSRYFIKPTSEHWNKTKIWCIKSNNILAVDPNSLRVSNQWITLIGPLLLHCMILRFVALLFEITFLFLIQRIHYFHWQYWGFFFKSVLGYPGSSVC